MSTELQSLVDRCERLFPGAAGDLWKTNVIHGEEHFFARAPRGFNIALADVATLMMKLWGAGILRPIRFRPSHSRAAFLGLQGGGFPRPEPTYSCAASWDYEVVSDDVALLLGSKCGED